MVKKVEKEGGFPPEKTDSHPSSTPLLDQIKGASPPPRGLIGALFGNNHLKKPYVNALIEKCCAPLAPSYAPEDASLRDGEFPKSLEPILTNILSSLSLSQLKKIDSLLTHHLGAPFLTALTAVRYTPSGVRSFHTTLERVLSTPTERVFSALENTEALHQMLGESVPVAMQLACIESVMDKGSDALSSFLEACGALLKETTVYLYGEKETEEAISAYEKVDRLFDEAPVVRALCKQVIDMSCPLNTQVLQYAVGCFVHNPAQKPRYGTRLQPRDDAPLCLFQEFFPSQTLYKKSAKPLSSPLVLTLRLTHPHTYATEVIEMPLPLEGEMSAAQAHEALLTLEKVVQDPDTKAPKSFHTFAHQLQQRFGQAVRNTWSNRCTLPYSDGHLGEKELPNRTELLSSLHELTSFGPVDLQNGTIKGAFNRYKGDLQLTLIYEDLQERKMVHTFTVKEEGALERFHSGLLEREVYLLKLMHKARFP